MGRAAGYSYRQARRAAQAEGAGESGLSRLIEVNAFGTAGDAAVAVSLAGTLFFTVPTNEARGQVALFLGLTMLPFAVVAPLIGPFLDRFPHGRRWAIGATFAARAFLCWILAGAVRGNEAALFPAALGCLVCSKAYGITKASAVPRLLPRDLTLVRANSRISLAGVVGVAISAPLAIGASKIGAEWSLRYGFVVFVVGTILAVLLPARVDEPNASTASATPPSGPTAEPGHAAGAPAPGSMGAGADGLASARLGGPAEPTVNLSADGRPAEEDVDTVTPPPRIPRMSRILRRLQAFPRSVVVGLRSNSGLRLLSGFLTLYLAFVLREHPFPSWHHSPTLLLGLVIGAAGVGNSLGIVIGNLVRRVRPELAVVAALVADAVVTTLTAIWWVLPLAVLLGLTAGVCQSFAKLSLDALIQRDVPERTRASTFGRSETLLQLSWVVGGFIGISMPLVPRLGLGVAAAILLACLVWTVAGLRAAHVARAARQSA
ncbi:putative integral membrane protein [Nostocoides japonicum T1-X7]|uniref:Putative integral membrane protein n=1 Tax=Nostocoides japonicum T1-X7 TaxID=1194083 RepID=A0A077M1M9_9MICO|nr:putative integral membrane protein [Tetrasphaera japonica T1-X7]